MPTSPQPGPANGLDPVHLLPLHAFRAIARRRLRRSFRALRLANGDALREASIDTRTTPLVVYLNHPSWWDPLVGFVLAQHLFGDRRYYVPMDADQLRRYPILRRLGMFPLELDSPRGGAQFLRGANAALDAGHILAITPQGRFADVRERPPVLLPGLASLLRHRSAAGRSTTLLPVALEYTFWNQRFPEALALCGEPFQITGTMGTGEIGAMLVDRLQAAQTSLAGRSQARDAGSFRTIIEGRTGTGGVYNLLEWVRGFRTKDHGAGDG